MVVYELVLLHSVRRTAGCLVTGLMAGCSSANVATWAFGCLIRVSIAQEGVVAWFGYLCRGVWCTEIGAAHRHNILPQSQEAQLDAPQLGFSSCMDSTEGEFNLL